MPGSRRAAKGVADLDEPNSDERSHYKVRTHDGFERAKHGLDPTVRAEADALFHEFIRLWKSGVSDDELRPRWDYKRLGGKGPRSVGLRQVRLLRQRRVLFIILTADKVIWLLEVFTKTSAREQDEAIARAIGYASDIREGRYA